MSQIEIKSENYNELLRYVPHLVAFLSRTNLPITKDVSILNTSSLDLNTEAR